jgi:hypothetical protein
VKDGGRCVHPNPSTGREGNSARFARVLLLPFEHACECRSRVCRTRSDPDTTVLIPPIAFEPFDRPRRQIIGNHPPAIEPERGMVGAGVSERNNRIP